MSHFHPVSDIHTISDIHPVNHILEFDPLHLLERIFTITWSISNLVRIIFLSIKCFRTDRLDQFGHFVDWAAYTRCSQMGTGIYVKVYRKVLEN